MSKVNSTMLKEHSLHETTVGEKCNVCGMNTINHKHYYIF